MFPTLKSKRRLGLTVALAATAVLGASPWRRPPSIGSFDSEKACVTALNIGPGPSTLLGCYPLIYQPII